MMMMMMVMVENWIFQSHYLFLCFRDEIHIKSVQIEQSEDGVIVHMPQMAPPHFDEIETIKFIEWIFRYSRVVK